jgi:hypothetical protein
MDNFIIFIFVVVITFFLFQIFLIYNKRYKKEKLERDKENSRFETLSSIKNKSIATLPINGFYIKCSIVNNDSKNKKMMIKYKIENSLYSPIFRYDDRIFDDVETINPDLFQKVTLEGLKEKLEEAVLNEKYEEAEKLRKEINKLKAQ